MKIGYISKIKVNFAEIQYNEEEEKRFYEIMNHLEKQCGWEVDASVPGWAWVIVKNHKEYEAVRNDYQRAKRIIK